MKEIWKEISGYEGLYRISNFGNVYSIISNKILKPTGGRKLYKGRLIKSYLNVRLWKNEKGTMFKIHRLVALHFVNNPKNYSQINHIDEDIYNNNSTNLEWCDSSYNHNYGSRNVRSAQSLMNSNNLKKVYQYDINNNLINSFLSVADASRKLNIPESSIYTACKGYCKDYKTGKIYKNNITHGYIFSYNAS